MKLKRIVPLFLVLCMMVSMLAMTVSAETIVASGECGENGDNLTWKLDSEGTLTISGTGRMMDMGEDTWPGQAPWDSHRNSITKVVIEDGVTYIDNDAFTYYTKIQKIMIPESVSEIGWFLSWGGAVSSNAPFLGCTGIKSIGPMGSGCDLEFGWTEKIPAGAFFGLTEVTKIIMPETINAIGERAFRNMGAGIVTAGPIGSGANYEFGWTEEIPDGAFSGALVLQSVTLPDTITRIGKGAFYECRLLPVLNIPEGVTDIGDNAFSYCAELRSISLPEGLKSIGKEAFYDCTSLTNLELPAGLKTLGKSAFVSCGSLKSVVIPDQITEIDESLFSGCGSLEQVLLPEGITSIGRNAFSSCRALTQITLPENLTSLGGWAFSNCSALQQIRIPASVTSLGDWAFGNCTTLGTIEFTGAAPSIEKNSFYGVNATAKYPEGDLSWTAQKMQNYGGTLTWLPYDPGYEVPEGRLVIYSDYSNLSVRTGGNITLSAGLVENGERIDGYQNITFQVDDTSVLEVAYTSESDNCRAVRLKALKPGSTVVAFQDTKTGEKSAVLVTVYEDDYQNYTLSTVPEWQVGKDIANFYNFNGLYIDSFQYTVNEDQSAIVTFDAYNTNYTYGVVEVCDENGEVISAAMIDKMTSGNTSIKETLWDGTGNLISDIFTGDMLTYKQKTGFSKKTSVKVEIPSNGYIRICNDADASAIYTIVNTVDIFMQLSSMAGDVKNFDASSKEFAEALSLQMIQDAVSKQLIQDGDKVKDILWKNVNKSVFLSGQSIGEFCDAIAHNINQLNLGSLIAKTAGDFGWSIGEDVVTAFMGPINAALDLVFMIGKTENVIIQTAHLRRSSGAGYIVIQNQGGGSRSCQQVKVESDSLTRDIALSVFSVTLDSELVNNLQNIAPELYEAITEGTTYTYDITLLKNGRETQPEDAVRVYIPIPEELRLLAYAGKTKVYRVEEDGTMTQMDAEIDGGCYVFTTDHFSIYTLVGYDPGPQIERFSLYGSSMTLGNALDMNFFVYQSDIGDTTGNYAVITKHYADGRPDAVVTVAQEDWLPLGNVYYYFTFSGVRAKEMADKIDVVIYNADGEAISEVFTDSVQGYARRMLDNPETIATHRTLYIEMLNYGAAAQAEFKYDVDNLANSVITAEEQAEYGMKDRTYVNQRQSDAAYFGTTLTLENQIVFNIFFNGSYVPEGAYAVAAFVNHKGEAIEEKVTNFEKLANYQYASFKSLVVADCSELITVKLYDRNGKLVSTVVDSIEGYAARMTSSGPLYVAIMKFADAAYEYFHGCRHIWGDWTVVTEPTYTAEGTQQRSCTKCGTQEFQTIPKLEQVHSDLYIEGVSVENVITYFNEVCLDAEYGGSASASLVQKWMEPIYYYYQGNYTQQDIAVLERFVAELNSLEGFPGIYESDNWGEANLEIYFCDPDAFPGYVGDWAYGQNLDGAVSFWYNNNEIYYATICYSDEMRQYTRNSVILEEIYNGLGPIQDTVLREDSIIYQYFTEPQDLTEVDWLILKLLYHEEMKCGMDAEACEQVIRKLYY